MWRESSLCTRTWNNSVLQFLKVSDMLEHDAGFLLRDTVTFSCTVLDCCPWFDFAEVDQVRFLGCESFAAGFKTAGYRAPLFPCILIHR